MTFPDLVKSWIYFEKDDYNKLEIGGFNGQDWGPDLKWVINHDFPYIDLLDEDVISSGLFIELATTTICNTIIGLPHIQCTGLTYHPKSNIGWLALLERSFDVEYKQTDDRDTLQIMVDKAPSLIAQPYLGVDVSYGFIKPQSYISQDMSFHIAKAK